MFFCHDSTDTAQLCVCVCACVRACVCVRVLVCIYTDALQFDVFFSYPRLRVSGPHGLAGDWPETRASQGRGKSCHSFPRLVRGLFLGSLSLSFDSVHLDLDLILKG